MPYPEIVVLFTSFRCNARCIMCSAWRKQVNHQELTVENIDSIFSDRILKNSVRIVNLTGGEPTLRDELAEIVKVLQFRCRKLKNIDISTNGIETTRVIDMVEKILAILLPTNTRLTVSVSIDGLDQVHDSVRGIPEAFQKIDKTINELKELMRLYPAFSVGLNTTVNKINYENLELITKYAAGKSLGVQFTLGALSEIGVESLPVQDAFTLDEPQKKIVANFINKLLKKQQIHPDYACFLLDWLKTGIRKGKCAFRKGLSLLCEPDGAVYQCGNYKDFKLGNILEKPYSQLIRARFSHWPAKYKSKCASCNSNCYFKTA